MHLQLLPSKKKSKKSKDKETWAGLGLWCSRRGLTIFWTGTGHRCAHISFALFSFSSSPIACFPGCSSGITSWCDVLQPLPLKKKTRDFGKYGDMAGLGLCCSLTSLTYFWRGTRHRCAHIIWRGFHSLIWASFSFSTRPTACFPGRSSRITPGCDFAPQKG